MVLRVDLLTQAVTRLRVLLTTVLLTRAYSLAANAVCIQRCPTMHLLLLTF